MTQNNTTTVAAPLFSLAFKDPEGEAQQSFMEEVGTLVFQSALIKYFASTSEEELSKFEVFINLHIGSEKFLEMLSVEYPDFREILEAEMLAFKSEVDSLN